MFCFHGPIEQKKVGKWVANIIHLLRSKSSATNRVDCLTELFEDVSIGAMRQADYDFVKGSLFEADQVARYAHLFLSIRHTWRQVADGVMTSCR